MPSTLSSTHISLPHLYLLNRATSHLLKILMNLTEGSSVVKRLHYLLHPLADLLGWELMVNGPQALLEEHQPQIQRKAEFRKQHALVTEITCIPRHDPRTTVVCLTRSTATSGRRLENLTATSRRGNEMQTYHPSHLLLLTLHGKLGPAGVEGQAKIAGVIDPRYPGEVEVWVTAAEIHMYPIISVVVMTGIDRGVMGPCLHDEII